MVVFFRLHAISSSAFPSLRNCLNAAYAWDFGPALLFLYFIITISIPLISSCPFLLQLAAGFLILSLTLLKKRLRMPLYPFMNPETGEKQDLFFNMDDEKKYIDENGVEWKRDFIAPQLNTAGSIDPWNSDDFVNKTSTGKGSMGDLIDRSAELSAKRAQQNDGVDPVRQEYFKKYSKERKGAKHTQDPTRND